MRGALNILHARNSALPNLRPAIGYSDVTFAYTIALHSEEHNRGGRHYGTATAGQAVGPVLQKTLLSGIRSNFVWEQDWTAQQYNAAERVTPPYGARRYDLVIAMEEGIKEKMRRGRGTLLARERSFWLRYLRYRVQKDGKDGIKAVWRLLRDRRLDLPMDTSCSHKLWESFLSNPEIQKEVVQHAVDLHERLCIGKNSNDFTAMYVSIMKAVLLNQPDEAFPLHTKLYRPRLVANSTVLPLLDSFAAAYPHTSHHYKLIHADIQNNPLYNAQQDTHEGSRHVKSDENTAPSNRIKGNPVLRSRRIHDPAIVYGTPARNKGYHGTTLKTEDTMYPSDRPVHPDTSPTRRRRLNLASSEGVFETNSKLRTSVPTWLVRKTCATTAFSLDFVVKILNNLAVEELDPVSFRELALRVPTSSGILSLLDKLDAADISLTTSKFVSTIRKLAMTGDEGEEDLRHLLQSDMHPEEYEDAVRQRALLKQFLTRGERASAVRILKMMTSYSKDSEFVVAQWNIVVAAYARQSRLKALLPLLDDMFSHGIPLTESTLSTIFHSLMRPRDRSKPVNHRLHERRYDDLALISNIWRRVLEYGGHLPPQRWWEVLKRLGIDGRLSDLSSIMLWIARWYSPNGFDARLDDRSHPQTPEHFTSSESCASDSPHYIWTKATKTGDYVFPEIRMKALIQWAFKSMHRPIADRAPVSQLHHPSSSEFPPAMEGFRDNDDLPSAIIPSATQETSHPVLRPLLSMLQLQLKLRTLGVNIPDRVVRNALSGCLWTIFGPTQSNRRINRIISERFPVSLDEVVYEVQKLWPGGLFDVDPAVLERLRHERSKKQTLRLTGGAAAESSVPEDARLSRERGDQLRRDKATVLRAVFGQARKANLPEHVRVALRNGRGAKVPAARISVDDWIEHLKRNNTI